MPASCSPSGLTRNDETVSLPAFTAKSSRPLSLSTSAPCDPSPPPPPAPPVAKLSAGERDPSAERVNASTAFPDAGVAQRVDGARAAGSRQRGTRERERRASPAGHKRESSKDHGTTPPRCQTPARVVDAVATQARTQTFRDPYPALTRARTINGRGEHRARRHDPLARGTRCTPTARLAGSLRRERFSECPSDRASWIRATTYASAATSRARAGISHTIPTFLQPGSCHRAQLARFGGTATRWASARRAVELRPDEPSRGSVHPDGVEAVRCSAFSAARE